MQLQLLEPDDGAQPILLARGAGRRDLHAGDEVPEAAGGGVAREDGDVAAGLAADGDEVAGRVDGEGAREPGVGVRRPQPGDPARLRVDGVGRQRVLPGAERLVGAVRRVQEVVPDVDLGRLGARGRRRALRVRR